MNGAAAHTATYSYMSLPLRSAVQRALLDDDLVLLLGNRIGRQGRDQALLLEEPAEVEGRRSVVAVAMMVDDDERMLHIWCTAPR